MAEKRDYYEVLGLQKGASDDEIKKAYRRMAKQYHPDLHPGDKNAEEKFKEVNEAYGVLSDEKLRAKYDQFGFAGVDPNYGAGGAGGFTGDFGDIFGGFGDIFGDLFGGGRSRQQPNAPRKGESLRLRIAISFEEAAFGCKKDIQVPHTELCPDCGGSGCEPGTKASTCPDCRGSGTVRVQQRTPFGVMQSSSVCTRCGGKGKIIDTPCRKCRGEGTVRVHKTLNVDIPAGVDDGDTLSLRGQGNAGVNGGPAGDLLLTMQVKPSKTFTRDGDSVLVETEIGIVQATLGAEVEVPTLDGPVLFTVPEGTQNGEVFRLRGKGIPNRYGGRGDQYINVRVVVPKGLNNKQKELLQAFGDSLGEKHNPLKKKGKGKIL